ncbi:MAG: glycosyltransferase involved in cell wall biosynthesis, partial [Granulosicoccus sp.]
MNEIPLVTVLLPVYNAEKFLEQAIRSVLDQTFTEFEFLIINDGSTDRSEEIIVSFNDSRIRYIKNETNLKLIKTLNKGIEFASGKYIARMDADDISLPTRFEQQVALLEKQPEIGVCGTNCIIFTTKGEESPSQYASDNDEIKFNMLR